MTSASDAFERKARKVRRALRRHPALSRLANAIGVPVWRWYLQRQAGATAGLDALPRVVRVDPNALALALRPEVVAALAGPGAGRYPVGLVRGGSWDRRIGSLPRSGAPREAASPPEPEPPGGGVPEPDPEGPWTGLVVAMDRIGRICFVDGPERPAAPPEPGRGRVPALVAVRHKRWARIATEIRAYARQRGGRAYQPYLHPDLADLPSDQGHERFDVLLAALPIRSGTLVDLGANSGYFSHRFEEAGFDCVAVERSEKEAHFLKAQRDACGRRFQVLKGSLTEVVLPERPDMVLALNIFHHFLKTEASFRELETFLGRLRARFLLFESHLPGEGQMAGAYRDMAPAEFVEWVRGAGEFGAVHQVGAAADGRTIFRLDRG